MTNAPGILLSAGPWGLVAAPAWTVGAIQFNSPWWWVVYAVVAVLLVWIGRRSLSGLSGNTRRVALVIRLVVAALFVAALAQPQIKREAQDVAVTLVVDASKSQPRDILKQTQAFVAGASTKARPEDLIGFVTTARQAGIQRIPARLREANIDAPTIVNTDATDLAAGVRAAMSIMPPGAANRIVLISDGNETLGNLMDAARAAEAAGVPIDVLPVRYTIEREVIVDRLIAPALARPGEVANVRVVITATRATSGRLTILMNGQAVDLDPDSPELGTRVDLAAGTNVQTVPLRLPDRGPVNFEAVFEPVAAAGELPGDTLAENNKAQGVTFISGKGRVLVIKNAQPDADAQVAALGRVLASGARAVDIRTAADAWGSLAELGVYDAVILVNAAAYEFNQQQQEELKSYVHDLGGGLIMTGGDQSFGAGGWIGSVLADALPIKLDPPQKRQMPRGALALVMHSCEMPNGNYWGRRTAEAAISALQAQDVVGVIEYNWQGGEGWVFPMGVIGDKSAVLRSLAGLTYGDAPDFESMLSSALKGLTSVPAGQKHTIIISDGDPSGPSDALLNQFVAAKISISTVAVFPHGGGKGDPTLVKMQRIARTTGGNYYEITDMTGNLNALPEIFIKEAQTVKRSLIWEGDPVTPTLVAVTEGTRGIAGVPAITGYVVAAEREGLAQTVLRGPESDPILAQWQHGLGRVVAYTSDLSGKWGSRWLGWEQFRQFWDQHTKWAMRPASNPNIRVVAVDKGDQTQIIVEAVDDAGDRLNFLRWQNRAVLQNGQARAFDLVQTGPGRYEGTVDTSTAGVYTLNMGYADPGAPEGASGGRGSVQAAVTRPFADEFRSLRDNSVLLESVAKRTGGRVLDFAPGSELWSRSGLTMPVSLRPIWLAVAIAGIGLFLVDVAVRRVRIDVRAIAGRVGVLFGRVKEQGATQVQALAQARQRAKERMAERVRETGGSVGQSTAIDAGGPDGAGVGGRERGLKFEASAEQLAQGARDAEALARRPGAPVVVKQTPKGDQVSTGEAGMSRLKKAKQRAQDENAQDESKDK